jgi:SpoVK/Ycf46/Vps4 family AAA+-type ATPase
MRGNYFYSVKDLSKAQNLSVAYFLYLISLDIEDLERNEECQVLYEALVSALNLTEHSRLVIQAVINQHIKSKKLTPAKENPDNPNPYDMNGKLKTHYKEDEDIYDNDGGWSSDNEDEINLVRAVFAGKSEWFSRIIAFTFFEKADKRRKSFTLPKEISIDNNVANAIFLPKNRFANFMISDFLLSEMEGKILNISYLSATMRELNRLFSTLIRSGNETPVSLFAKCLNVPIKTVLTYLRKDKKLVAYGLVDNQGEIADDVKNCIYDGHIDSLFTDVLKVDDKKDFYPLQSYSVKEDEIALASRLLKNDAPMNLLLYGAAGAGKTQFARSLVHSLGLKTLIFKNELEVSNDDSDQNPLCRLNSLLSLYKKDSVIIVDEAEGILKTQGSFFGMTFSLPQKGIVNKMLEESNNKVIWILNYTHELDESTRRRFTYSIKFSEMSRSMLKTIADTKLNKINMSTELHSELVDLCGKYRVTGASVDNMVKTVSAMDLNGTNEGQIVSDVKKVLESNSTLIYGKKKMRENVRSSYDLSVLNTSIPAQNIVDMVMNAQEFAEANNNNDEAGNGIRMLFYGLSGTGKTELARYIAEKLNKKIIIKRPSDIFGMYVGENEENIKKAFEQAESSGDILLFDEADSFFTDRSNARTSWERTTVNEFLTQMEEFSGILICTTNLRQIMDPAMQRRFHILTEFKPLRRGGIKKLLLSFFGSYDFDEEQLSAIAKYNSVTPGDFASLFGKIRFMPKTEITSQLITSELCKIQEEKACNSKPIGFAV